MSLYQYGFVRNKESSSTSEININEERSDSIEDTGSKKKVLKNKSDNKQFQYSWLTEFQWLRYNTDNKIMYCIYCRNHNIKTTAFALIEMLSNDYSEVAVNLYEDLCSWRMIGFFYFLYDILSYLTQLSKFFQKENLQFCDIQPMIEGTIKSIEKEYIHINDIQHFFGANFQNLMVTTNPFNSSPNIGGHLLKFTDEDYDDLLVDICRYSSSLWKKRIEYF
ncbi:1489_t:CDS:2, partial [Entrophospora sp. SA101]